MIHYIQHDLESDWAGWAMKHEYSRFDRLLSGHAELDRRFPYRCQCGSVLAPALERLGATICHDCKDLTV